MTIENSNLALKVALTLVLAIAVSAVPVAASPDTSDSRVAQLKQHFVANPKGNLWWIIPLDEKWQKFRFLKLSEAGRDDFFRMLDVAEFSDMAGNYTLMDLPYQDVDKRGQGFLVLESINKGGLFGFEIKPTAVNKKALVFVEVSKINPSKNIILYKYNTVLQGVVLKDDFRALLQKERAAELAAKKTVRVPDDRGK